MGVPLTMTTLSFSLQTKQKNGIWKTPSLPLWMVHLGTNKSKRLKGLVSNDSWGLICQLSLSSSEERTQETLRALWTVSPGNHLQRRTQTHGVPPGVTGWHYGLSTEGTCTSGPPYSWCMVEQGTWYAPANLQMPPKEADSHLNFGGDEVKRLSQLLKEILRSQNPNSQLYLIPKMM